MPLIISIFENVMEKPLRTNSKKLIALCIRASAYTRKQGLTETKLAELLADEKLPVQKS